ncbi:methyl-accepting chemotaxis protein [Photobacterium atrarenae]|uniref:Methyl-accepting chemotaxis protein n=1 Tax=Photobacterium atrarenae TaxID=865757 RepID=A0ABY5GNV6_9GAMM|nr:methyl-accepting chemotaxis protein [Photobacterium atrarenae]
MEAWFGQKSRAIDAMAADYRADHDVKRLLETVRLVKQASDLATILYGFDDGRAYSTLSGGGWHNGIADPAQYDPRQRPWYAQAQAASGVELTDFYTDSTTGKLVVSLIKGIPGGAVLGDIELDILAETVANVDIPGAVAAIVDEHGQALASNSAALTVGTRLNEIGLSVVQQMMLSQDAVNVDYTLKGVDKVAFTKAIHLVNGQKWYLFIGIDKSVAYAEADQALTQSIISSLIMIAIATALVLALLNVLYRPITALKSVIVDLSQGNGDLTRRLPVTSQDDLGKISEGINTFIASLQSLMLEVAQSSTNISRSVDALKQQTETNAEILTQHSSETEQVVTAIEEMSSTASDVAGNASQASQFTQSTHTQVAKSGVIVTEAAATAAQMITDVDQTAAQIAEINQASQDITKVLEIIGEIAEQTNLLALNAAIEAARAGSQGRGFAVVADEVRALAARTQASTAEIEQTVKQLRQSSDAAINAMQATKATCEATEQQSQRIASDLTSVGDSVTQVNDLNAQIATAAEQQSSVTQEISRNMSAIREIVMTIAKNGEDTSSEALNLAAANSQLESVVAEFKLQ